MKQTIFRPVVVIEMNVSHYEELKTLEESGLSYIEALGSYKGTTNRCYIIDIGQDGSRYGMIDQHKLNEVLDMASYYKQESVLILDYKRRADLFYLNSQRLQNLGQLMSISKNEAMQSDAWTYVNETYYKAG